jgi:hypothetical protein
MWRHFLLAALVGFGAWHWYHTHAVTHGPGVIAPDDPVQTAVDGAAAFEFKGARVTPLADFRIEARVLATERYRLGREAEFSPIDLALGWGPMSDEAVLRQLRIRQTNRFYLYSWSDAPPVPEYEMITHSANMHMIPADSLIERQLEGVRPGQIIALQGQLVQIDTNDGWHWRSSLTRSDTGAGACEVVWVESVAVR